MELGIYLGPRYYATRLRSDKSEVIIERPKDAASLFFKYLKKEIVAYVANENLPSYIAFSVSVPAAFEANQRQDLYDALRSADIPVEEYSIIDEPNAAFLNYIVETLKVGEGMVNSLGEQKRRIMVFDFGAGTCDISVLEVGLRNKHITSKNLSISQFMALGGNNIDRCIVKKLLFSQMMEQAETQVDFTSNEIREIIVPKLMTAAEELKILCCKHISSNWTNDQIAPYLNDPRKTSGKDIAPFKIRDFSLKLSRPTVTYGEVADIMMPFIEKGDLKDVNQQDEEIRSIFIPVESALRKADIKKDDLHMILMIGGSSLNPYIQYALKDYFGRFVDTVFHGDVRLPVSKGAAINSLIVNGLKTQFLKPITSETIYVITKGGGLREILPAGSEIPSSEVTIDDLEVQRDGQKIIELPICVTSEDKLLSILEINVPARLSLIKGDQVVLKCKINENKLLEVDAKAHGNMLITEKINPLSNTEITPLEAKMLSARVELNRSAWSNNGRPSISALQIYAEACADAGHHLEAAESYEAVMRLDPVCDFSTLICYHFSLDRKGKQADYWAFEAYKRDPGPVNAYNLALTKQGSGDLKGYEELMEEVLSKDPEFTAALDAYGHYLKGRREPRGLELIKDAFTLFLAEFDNEELQKEDYFRFKRVAKTMGRTDILQRIDRKESLTEKKGRAFVEDQLLVSRSGHNDRIGEK